MILSFFPLPHPHFGHVEVARQATFLFESFAVSQCPICFWLAAEKPRFFTFFPSSDERILCNPAFAGAFNSECRNFSTALLSLF